MAIFKLQNQTCFHRLDRLRSLAGPRVAASSCVSIFSRSLKMRVLVVLMALIVLPAMAAGCRQSQQVLHDGYYTAQSAQYCAEGWKDYLTIYVNDGVIATAEFNAVNSSGLLRSWDQDYMSKIYDRYHVNPNLFPRLYINYLLSVQDPDQIQPAKHGRKTHEIFVLLARQAIESSRLGNLSVAEVHLPQTRFPDDI